MFTRYFSKLLLSLRYPVSLDWKKITLPDGYIYHDNPSRRNKLIKQAFNAVLKYEPKVPFNVSTSILFIKSLKRTDYNEFVRAVASVCELPNRVVDIEYGKKKKNVFLLLKLVLYLPLFIKIMTPNLKCSFYKYLKIIMYISVWKIFTKYHFNVLVAFADMQAVENMLIQYYRKKGVKTVTLQHGLYVDYSDYDNINRINYLNVVSKYFLAWGLETKELIQKYHPDTQNYICGKPIFFQRPSKSSGYFTLVFDQLLFTEQNKQLLEIAYATSKRFSLLVNVRIHPWDKMEKYSFINERTLYNADIGHSDFVIGHTTSMVFECMRNGIPAFKYKTIFPSNKIIQDSITFSNQDELIQRIENIKEYSFAEIGKYYIEYVGEESLNQYAGFFNSINGK